MRGGGTFEMFVRHMLQKQMKLQLIHTDTIILILSLFVSSSLAH